jgi:CubicO group peptidase (beta-lactamase class C family)
MQPMRFAQRFVLPACSLALVAGLLAACPSSSPTANGTGPSHTSPGSKVTASVDPKMAAAIDAIVQDNISRRHLRALIVRVTVDGKNIITKAYGESMTGVPATTDMHFRNGAVAISYVSTILLQLVDEKKVRLDDKISKWVPEIPHSDEVTLGQLAQMTSGYTDYVIGNDQVDAQLLLDPYRQWTPEELLAYVTSKPLLYTPGTNWNYAHTNYLILGLTLEKITGKSVSDLMQERIFGPLGMTNTSGNDGTPAIPAPALHSFTSERRQALGIPAGTGFYEESTFWNPSWTITHGAIQTTDIVDMDKTAIAVGSGKLLSPESYQKMISPDLRGKTTVQPNCPATCLTQNDNYAYGLGTILTGNWIEQDPLFSGEAAAFGYLPSEKVAISVAVTFDADAFDPTTGSYVPATGPNAADLVWREIGQVVAPKDPPPLQRK